MKKYALFADLFDYPTPKLGQSLTQLKTVLKTFCTEAVERLTAMEDLVKQTPTNQLEEIYSGVFELNASLHPYIGHHLFGESYKRSLFMVGLKEHYQKAGIGVGSELPDHLSLILRFLSTNPDRGFARELIHLTLLPSLEKMTRDKKTGGEKRPPKQNQGGRAYRSALVALKLVLEKEFGPAVSVSSEESGTINLPAAQPGWDSPLEGEEEEDYA